MFSKNVTKFFVTILIITEATRYQAEAAGTCNGKFVNPVTDICWSCVFPISIGNHKLMKGRRDSRNPSNPVCACLRDVGGPQKVPVPGIVLGFWEPIRLIDVTRTPFCMVNLLGQELPGLESMKRGGIHKTHTEEENDKIAFYHTHYYVYPLIYWLEILTDMGCLEAGTFDLAYMSEFDPLYNDDSLNNLLAPEVILFANPLAQTICVADCLASNFYMGIDLLYWCSGCQGSLFPLTGYVAGATGGIMASNLLANRVITKYHRMGLALETSTDTDEWFDGPLCKKHYYPILKKSQYKLQMTYPVTATSGEFACVPLGVTDFLYNQFKETPVSGEDFGYLLWRKKNCCFL